MSTQVPNSMIIKQSRRHGVWGHVKAGDFYLYPALTFHFPPIQFNTHQLDSVPGDWRLRFNQNLTTTRLKLALFNDVGFGFRMRLPGKLYTSIEDIFKTAQGHTSRVVPSEYANIGFPADTSTALFVEPDEEMVYQYLAKYNEQRRQRLGDWRPAKPPMANNVIDLIDHMDINTNIDTRDIQDRLRKIG